MCVLIPDGWKFAPLSTRRRIRCGYFAAKVNAMFPPSEKTQQATWGKFCSSRKCNRSSANCRMEKGRCSLAEIFHVPAYPRQLPGGTGKIKGLVGRSNCCPPISMESNQGKPIAIGLIVERNIHVLPPSLYSPYFLKKTGRYENRPVLCWRYLFSRFVSKQVSSAQVSLTSVFGMGTGGPSLQSTPTAAFRQAISILPCPV